VPIQTFLIVAARRSGSNLLCTLLNSHPEILCHHELFNPRGIFYALDFRNGSLDFGSLRERDADPFGFLNRVWQVSNDCRCVGFKMTRDQAAQVLGKVLNDSTVKKIIVRRRNRLKTLVSELIAEATDRWELYNLEKKTTLPKVLVDVDQLITHAAQNKTFYDRIFGTLKSSNQSNITLEYETLFSESQQKKTLTYLGVESVDFRLTPLSVKQTPKDLRMVLSNFSELDRKLSGTEFHRELHDLNH
jgi:hypothetical protein